ncbi:hypothetical protein PISMIDRAFT_267491 [Pisolithus microcarpus 441]|uniref:Uncharacterized protein n=1 Tax=Pisolithus microcarpus 441 TaxID=765257 RepID=A0A0C9YRD8_9AGAM|nr:hypothetical protein PISMIDRAFT_267491 [Pisolithus microcarpus 441]
MHRTPSTTLGPADLRLCLQSRQHDPCLMLFAILKCSATVPHMKTPGIHSHLDFEGEVGADKRQPTLYFPSFFNAMVPCAHACL